jgi:ketosteroid isomerase-like protein
MSRRFRIGWIVLFVALAAAASAQGSSQGLQDRLTAFVKAFDDLDWPRFRDCFSSGATVFHPAAPNVRRTEGEKEFEKAWAGVFDRIRKQSGRSGPPYIDLQPKDLRIDQLSPDVALVTFHLEDGKMLDRRTLVLKRFGDDWKIVHIHASNLVKP